MVQVGEAAACGAHGRQGGSGDRVRSGACVLYAARGVKTGES